MLVRKVTYDSSADLCKLDVITNLSGSFLFDHEIVDLLKEIGPDLIGTNVDQSLFCEG
jgi:hypothetical protein